jgi:putative oxidoreductase
LLFGGQSGLFRSGEPRFTLLRVFTGLSLALTHGIGKIPPSEGLIETTGSLGFPMPVFFAWAAGLSEFLGGILLALGFLTRVSSFFIAFTMLTAILGVHGADPYAKKELAFVYFFIATAFMLNGAGDWSIDRFLRKH